MNLGTGIRANRFAGGSFTYRYGEIGWNGAPRAHHWFGALLLINLIVAVTDRSHSDVEGANYRVDNSAIGKASHQFWDSAFEYLDMTVIPWEPNRQYIFACHPHGIHAHRLDSFIGRELRLMNVFRVYVKTNSVVSQHRSCSSYQV